MNLAADIDVFLAMLPARRYTRASLELHFGQPVRAALINLCATGRAVYHEDDDVYQSADTVPVLTSAEKARAKILAAWCEWNPAEDDEVDRALDDITDVLDHAGLVRDPEGDEVYCQPNDAGADLLDRARKAEVLP